MNCGRAFDFVEAEECADIRHFKKRLTLSILNAKP
jgi:hypothetical protein